MKEMIVFFKEVFEGTKLAWAIKAAGLAGVLEIIRIGWLAIRYLAKF
jgi:hypothetical protein